MGSSCCKEAKGHEMRTKLAEETMDRHIHPPKAWSESNQKRWNRPKIAPLAQAVNKLAIDIYTKIDASKPDQNIVFSPLAIALALALVETGMTGKSRSEIHKLIAPAKTKGEKTECGKLYGVLQEKILNIPESDGELRLCNVLFRDHGTSVNETYQKKVKDWLKTEVIAAPFKKDAEKARQQVNRWISEKTLGKIPDLLRRSRQETALLLANAIYMRMDWQATFFGQWRADWGTFHSFGREEEQTVKISRRCTRDELGFNFRRSFAVLELPYTGGKLAMYIILPDLRDGLREIEKQLSADWLISIFSDMRLRPEMDVTMPKFTMRRTISLLPIFGVETLNGLGRMTSNDGATISEAVHEACIQVDDRQKPPDKNGTPLLTIYIPPTPFTVDHPSFFSLSTNRLGQSCSWER